MILKRISLLAVVMIALTAVSCKKDKTDDSVNGRFQGNWVESSAKAASIVVSTPPAGDENLPNLTLHIASTGYFFMYRFNGTGDSVYLSDLSTGGAKNVPYKITFSDNAQSFTIKKFHAALPNVDPLTFNKQQ